MTGQDRLAAPAAWLGGALLGPLRRIAGATIVAAGPWLVAVAALAVVSVTMRPVLGGAALEDLRLTVVYAFLVAPLVAGPVGAVAARMIAAEVDAGALRLTPALFLAAAALSGLGAQAVAVALCVALALEPIGVAVAFAFLSAAAALLWTSFAVLTALRSFRFLIGAFCGGMAASVACSMVAAQGEVTVEVLIWSFTAGIALCVTLSLAWVRRLAGTGGDAPVGEATGALLAELWRQRVLCAGVLLAVAAVWVDKWVFWLGPNAARSAAGYLNYSPYDTVMFAAHLSAIPTYAGMLLLHEGVLVDRMRTLYARLGDGSTLATIRSTIGSLEQSVWSTVFGILFFQAALTTCAVLMAPLLARSLNFSFEQFLMLRVALIAVLMHCLLYLASAIVLVCNRARHFALLQGGFLLANLVLSVLFSAIWGVTAYALFASALMAGVLALVFAALSLSQLTYLTFLGENEALYAKRV